MTRSRDVADTQDNLGGAVAPVVSGKNVVINGATDFWSRGTSSTAIGTTKTFLADRWFANTGGGTTTFTYARTTSVPTGFQYGIQIQRTASNTGTTAIYLQQDVETVNSIPFAGKTVTFSFYARAGANYSGSASGLNALLISGTGTDQTQYFAFYTGQATVATGTTTLTTSWQRFTYTGTIASNATQLGIQFNYAPTGTAGADDSFFIAGVQVEVGSVATPFSRAGGNSIGAELALCQRYFLAASMARFTSGMGISSGAIYARIAFPSQMRTTPSAALSPSGTTYTITDDYASAYSSTTVTTGADSWLYIDGARIALIGFSGLTTGRFYSGDGRTPTNGQVFFSAEL
jgi:hypothetical protein